MNKVKVELKDAINVQFHVSLNNVADSEVGVLVEITFLSLSYVG